MSNNYCNLIYKNLETPLSSIPFHRDTTCIKRFFSAHFPVHLAVHRITEADEVEEYTKPHTHDVPEINIIVGDEGELEYLVSLDDEHYRVCSNISIWIPAGLPHSANAIRGSGYYIAIRLDNYKENNR